MLSHANRLRHLNYDAYSILLVSDTVFHTKAIAQELLHTATKTLWSTLALLNFVCATVILGITMVKECFLPGPLSMVERSRALDRLLQYALVKFCFVGAIFDPISSQFWVYIVWTLTQATILAFIGIAGDRSESYLSSPTTSVSKHIRCSMLLASIFIFDGGLLKIAKDFAIGSSWSLWPVLWMIDAACIGIEALRVSMKYALQSLEYWLKQEFYHCLPRGETQSFLLNCGRYFVSSGFEDDQDDAVQGIVHSFELCADLAVQMLQFIEAAHLLHSRGGPKLQLVDILLLFDMRCLATGAWKRGQNHLQYRQICHRVKHVFPDVRISSTGRGIENGSKPQISSNSKAIGGEMRNKKTNLCDSCNTVDDSSGIQLAPQNCAICLETMSFGKKLPCGHIFHLRCLARWMRTNQNQNTAFSCPLCRSSLIVSTTEDSKAGSGESAGNHPIALDRSLWSLRALISGPYIPVLSLHHVYSLEEDDDWITLLDPPEGLVNQIGSIDSDSSSCQTNISKRSSPQHESLEDSYSEKLTFTSNIPQINSKISSPSRECISNKNWRPVTRSMSRRSC